MLASKESDSSLIISMITIPPRPKLDSRRDSSAAFPNEERLLPPDFQPSSHHVVCARGRTYWMHPGNVKYRRIVDAATNKYRSTQSKMGKSLIVREIIAAIYEAGGSLVKKCSGKKWVEVSEHFAREKISQSLRDNLHEEYRSSTKAKRRKQEAVIRKMDDDLDFIIQSNAFISSRIQQLSNDVQNGGSMASDRVISTLFAEANADILERIKTDETLNIPQDIIVSQEEENIEPRIEENECLHANITAV